VGRVWPRHSGGGRPLNSVVSHAMSAKPKRPWFNQPVRPWARALAWVIAVAALAAVVAECTFIVLGGTSGTHFIPSALWLPIHVYMTMVALFIGINGRSPAGWVPWK
jgi:hypothetical protein